MGVRINSERYQNGGVTAPRFTAYKQRTQRYRRNELLSHQHVLIPFELAAIHTHKSSPAFYRRKIKILEDDLCLPLPIRENKAPVVSTLTPALNLKYTSSPHLPQRALD